MEKILKFKIDNIVRFKSDDKYYWKEKDGRKCNTVRKDVGKNREILMSHMANYEQYGVIQITHSKNNCFNFARQITDICEFDGYFIISWRG